MTDLNTTLATIERRFISGNNTPVESARITKEEWQMLQKGIERLIMFEAVIINQRNMEFMQKE